MTALFQITWKAGERVSNRGTEVGNLRLTRWCSASSYSRSLPSNFSCSERNQRRKCCRYIHSRQGVTGSLWQPKGWNWLCIIQWDKALLDRIVLWLMLIGKMQLAHDDRRRGRCLRWKGCFGCQLINCILRCIWPPNNWCLLLFFWRRVFVWRATRFHVLRNHCRILFVLLIFVLFKQF